MKRRIAWVVALLIFTAVHAEAGPLSGKVLFQKSGAAVPHALIDFSSGARKLRAVTADDGSYYVADLPAGTYHVTITYRGKKQELDRNLPKDGSSFEVAP
ncbi:MAG TPA: carboxypeptidase-like regulatory domain-containing protein [Thermoanaerobaculia bacterium]|nr:carboxypeptidase-like regulatory domain-containing protein [Thermoanaerobaculia bacterium]